jgi:hypothetical protein
MTTSASASAIPNANDVKVAGGSSSVRSHRSHRSHSQDSRFSCNICLEAVTEPVVTQCGHLYCWPCLYQWLEPGMLPAERQALTGNLVFAGHAVDESRRVCPVCKACVSVPTIVPIYVRTEPQSPNRNSEHEHDHEHEREERSEFNDNDNDNDNHDEFNDDEFNDQEEELGERGTPDDLPEEITTDLDTSLPPSFRTANIPTASINTGLRQRLRFRSRDSEIPALLDSSFSEIPARPAASSPGSNNNRTSPPLTASSAASNNNSRNASLWVTPLSPTRNNRASLSHGLALSLQQVLRPAVTAAGNNPNQTIPPLHRQEGGGHGTAALAGHGHRHNGSVIEADPDATEFLSRILLMLGSFVILCLLLF